MYQNNESFKDFQHCLMKEMFYVSRYGIVGMCLKYYNVHKCLRNLICSIQDISFGNIKVQELNKCFIKIPCPSFKMVGLQYVGMMVFNDRYTAEQMFNQDISSWICLLGILQILLL